MMDEITVSVPPQASEVEVSGEKVLKPSILSTEEVDLPQNAKYEESESEENYPTSTDLEGGFDLDKFARAVAQKETQQCTAGVGRVNNCHGLRPGNTAPCTAGVTASNFCKFNSPEESYEAFKKIWSTWYTTDRFPSQEQAIRYSQDPGWRAIVINIYNKMES